MMSQQTETLDVVMRLHDARRLTELQRAVFSLVGQTYGPVHVNLCVQRFTRGMLLDTREALAGLLAMRGAPTLDILNFDDSVPADARAALANLGLDAARGRYLAFLDYDDALYPEAYALLIDRLRQSGCAIAFGGVFAKRIELEDDLIYVLSKERPWRGRSLPDLLEDNFCPLHSFVIDRNQLPADIRFDGFLNRLEDYDFLLQVCAACRSDFALIDTVIADYYLKNDGSNATPIGASATDANLAEWQRAREAVELRRRTTAVAPEVQRLAGIERPVEGLTISGVRARLGRSLRSAA